MHHGAGFVTQSVLVRHHGSVRRDQRVQLTRLEEELGPRGPTELLLPAREGLVDQHTTGRDAGQELVQAGPPQVVGDDDGGEPAPRERPGAVFEIEDGGLDVGVAIERGESGSVTIDGEHPEPEPGQEAGVPTGARGEIEHGPAPGDQARPAPHPGRGRPRSMHCGGILHIMIVPDPPPPVESGVTTLTSGRPPLSLMNRTPALLLALGAIALLGFLAFQFFGGTGAAPLPVGPGPAVVEPGAVGGREVEVDGPARSSGVTEPGRTAVPDEVGAADDLDPAIRAALCGFTGRLIGGSAQPVAGAKVKLFRIAADIVFQPRVNPFFGEAINEPQILAGTGESDDEGRFLIAGVFPFGGYLMHADADGESPTWRVIERSVAPGEIADLGDIVLELSGILTGTVVDDEGEPIGGALVRSIDLPGSLLALVPFERFDPSGAIIAETPERFVFEMPPWVAQRAEDLPIPHTLSASDGTFRLKGVAPGANLVAVNVPARVPHVKPRVVVEPGEEKDLGRIRVTEGETAFGRVEDDAGEPVEGAQVLVAARTTAAPVHFASYAASTDSKGEFSMSGLPAGDVVAAARRRPGEPWVTADPQPVVRDVILKIPTALTLTVRVLDAAQKPVADPRLRLTPGRGDEVLVMSMFGLVRPIDLTGRTTRGENEEWILSDLPKGRYILLADSPAHGITTKTIDLDANQSVDVVLNPKHGFEVVILRPDGGPAKGADLYAHARGGGGPDSPVHAGFADADGKVLVELISGNHARLTARHPAYGLVNAEAELPQANPVVMQFQIPGIIEGTLSEGGAPPPIAKYMLYASPRGSDGAMPQIPVIAAPDLDGRFRFPALAPGRYRIGVTEAIGGLRSPGGIMAFARASFFDSDLPSETVEVGAGQTHTLVFDTRNGPIIEGPTVRVSGSVTVNGRLGKDHVVTTRGTGSRQRRVVDQTGRFEFAQIKLGHVTIEVSEPLPEDLFQSRRGPDDLWEISFEAKEGEDVDLQIDIVTTTIEGYVRGPLGSPVEAADVNAQGTIAAGENRTGNVWRWARTDARGYFRFLNIAAGDWNLSASHEDSGRAGPVKVVVLAGQPAAGIELQMSPTFTVRGRIDTSALKVGESQRMYMWLESTRDGESNTGAQIESDGSFEAKGVADGSYRVRVNYHTAERQWETAVGSDEIHVAGRDLEGVTVRAIAEPPQPRRGGR